MLYIMFYTQIQMLFTVLLSCYITCYDIMLYNIVVTLLYSKQRLLYTTSRCYITRYRKYVI